MHVIVVGCGRVGSGLGTVLVEQGHSVAIIDRNAKAFRRLPAGWAGETVLGSGFDRNDLDRAGAARAGALAAVTSGDNSNILTARIARETYEIPQVVARIYDPRRAQIYQRLGIATVATVTWTIDQVLRRLLPATLEEWTDATGRLAVADHDLPSSWAGRHLAGLTVADRISLVAVTRNGTPRLDTSTLVGQDGDVLHLAFLKEARDELDALLASRPAGEDAPR